MEYRTLGSTQLEISVIGFGAWAIGGGGYAFGWGPQDPDEAIRAICSAVRCGVNWIDTAPAYGRGRSEETVGAAISSLPARERPFVFTKCGMVWNEANPSGNAVRTLTPESVRKECHASLKRLDVDAIDLFQIHQAPEIDSELETGWNEMTLLRDEGLVRAIGVSNLSVEQIERCEAIGHVDSVQLQLSLIARDGLADLVPLAIENGSGLLGYSPLQSGLLTDAFAPDRLASLPDDDWRLRAMEFQPPRLIQNLALRDGLSAVGKRLDTSTEALAVAWVISQAGITAAIVGARRPSQVTFWIDAASLKLSVQDRGEVAALVRACHAGSGPVE